MPPLMSGKKSFGAVTDEVGEGHLAGQDERDDPREQADHQQRPKHQFERAGRAVKRHQFDLCEHRHSRKLENLGDAELKQQKPGDEAKQAQRRRLPFREHPVELVHVIVPLVWHART